MKNRQLYIVATPIGNLADMTFRAVETLKTVDFIAAEDTRHAKILLQHYEIKTPLLAYHEHNEREQFLNLLSLLEEGKTIALISDAGTPLINDPGYILVKEARARGIKIIPIPGANAAITALSAAGLPTDRFAFEGFLPNKSQARLNLLKNLQHESRTLVFYETPHRVLAALEDLQTMFGMDREVTIARELTKMFETIHTDQLSNIISWMKNDANQQKGEFVILVAGAKESSSFSDVHSLLTTLLAELPLSQAVDIASKISNQRKNEIYALALNIQNKEM